MSGTAQKVSGPTFALGRLADLTIVSTTQQFPLGKKVEDQLGNVYRYVQNIAADTLALADGQVVYLADDGEWIVTRDFTGGSAVGGRVVGVAISTVAYGSYGWIQTAGIHDAVYTDGGVAAGDYLVGHSVDGEADTMADGEEEQVFGQALADDTATGQETCPALLYGN